MTLNGRSLELFETPPPATLPLAPGAVLLRAYAATMDLLLFQEIQTVLAAAPWRHMSTPGGLQMSVAMSSCGAAGWVSDRGGYRYAATDPLSGLPWPAMPAAFRQLAEHGARAAGYAAFAPDSCLINRYVAGASMGLHQDRNERDLAAPIVSVSLGLPAVFLFGGLRRAERPARIALSHGDVVVWGGPSRLNFHGVARIKPGLHAFSGDARINLTFRQAL
jgi:alkylated DNA repair protein (DNA oxidative demethylase)